MLLLYYQHEKLDTIALFFNFLFRFLFTFSVLSSLFRRICISNCESTFVLVPYLGPWLGVFALKWNLLKRLLDQLALEENVIRMEIIAPSFGFILLVTKTILSNTVTSIEFFVSVKLIFLLLSPRKIHVLGHNSGCRFHVIGYGYRVWLQDMVIGYGYRVWLKGMVKGYGYRVWLQGRYRILCQ